MTLAAEMRIAFIGGGAMAEAILGGVIRQKLYTAAQISVGEPLAERRQYLSQTYGVTAVADNGDAVAGAQIVILAVKPQVLNEVLAGLRGRLVSDVLVLSIVAGATVETIYRALGFNLPPAIVRVMPNTPGQIGEGISVWMATPETSPAQRQAAREIVGALGQEIAVEEERYLDMATAMSGSGPAYVFLFMEAFTDAGVRLGFSRAIAERLAVQTVRGAAIYAQESGLHLAELRNRVTSPGGTTAEALHVFEQGGLRATVADAVWAAYKRARALGGEE
jgi:pyrroline-5-carboxylate reductase